MTPAVIGDYIAKNWVSIIVAIIVVTPILITFINYIYRSRIENKDSKIDSLTDEIKSYKQGNITQNGIHGRTPESGGDDATRVLKNLQIRLEKSEGSFVISESTLENKKIATQLYLQVQGTIIATCFYENPSDYADDLAKNIHNGSKFYRIVTEDICPAADQKKQQNAFVDFECNAELIVLPSQLGISKISGIFCKCTDQSYLAFIALNHLQTKNNQGLIFIGKIAETLYKYYAGHLKNNQVI